MADRTSKAARRAPGWTAGVGKTSVVRAVAADMGWSVIELNASDDRNAAAIRRAATHGATHRSLFHDPN